MNDSIAARCIHATAASAASTSSSTIQPAPDRCFGCRALAWIGGGGLVSLRRSRIAPTDRTSAAIVTADS